MNRKCDTCAFLPCCGSILLNLCVVRYIHLYNQEKPPFDMHLHFVGLEQKVSPSLRVTSLCHVFMADGV